MDETSGLQLESRSLTSPESNQLETTTMKPNRRTTACTLLAGATLLALGAGPVLAQNYPTKPITLVVPFAAGGPTDVVARMLGATMTKTLGQTVVVENKVGAGGTIASQYTARANPDGYTFLIHHNGMATAPALYRKLTYNPLNDFEFVGQVIDVPMTLLGRKDLPVKDFPELVAWMKASGNKVNLAHAGLGAVSHLCGMLFRQAVGVDATTVPHAPAKSKPISVPTPKKGLFTKDAKHASAYETPNKTLTQSTAAPSTSNGFSEGDKVKIKKKGPNQGKTGVVCKVVGKRYKIKLDEDGSISSDDIDLLFGRSLEKL